MASMIPGYNIKNEMDIARNGKPQFVALDSYSLLSFVRITDTGETYERHHFNLEENGVVKVFISVTPEVEGSWAAYKQEEYEELFYSSFEDQEALNAFLARAIA